MTAAISLRGVRVHNLKNIDVDIPLGKITVFTGVSGAGKSSLVFDTLHAEAQRRYFQSLSPHTRQFLDKVQKPDADRIDNLPPSVAISQRTLPRGQRTTVGTVTEILDYLRLLFVRAGTLRCLSCGQDVKPSTPASVVATVNQFPPGTKYTVGFPPPLLGRISAEDWLPQLRQEGFVRLHVDGRIVRLEDANPEELQQATSVWVLVDRLEAGKASPDRISESVEACFRFGLGRLAIFQDDKTLVFDQQWACTQCNINYPQLEQSLLDFNDPQGACPTCNGTGQNSTKAKAKISNRFCPICSGTRLGELAGAIYLDGKNILTLSSWEIRDLNSWFTDKDYPDEDLLFRELRKRLAAMLDLGLDYLTLNRNAKSLSVGEGKRLRLAMALISNLANALYVMDEPTSGMHLVETEKLIRLLQELREEGNTLVLIDHNQVVLKAADYVIDLGPGAGEEGGTIVFQGTPRELLGHQDSLTAKFLRGDQPSSLPKRRSQKAGKLKVSGVTVYNLQDFSVEIPLGVLCVISGLSGAGKSVLLEEVLYPTLLQQLGKTKTQEKIGIFIHGADQLEEVVFMDQQPLPRTSRSNPITYIKAFDPIRQLFADNPESRVRNFTAKTFSFNQPGGRCETCVGNGTLTVNMQFLADISIPCPECGGTRFKKEVLEVKVRSLHIAEVMNLTVREAFRFFRAQPNIQRRLKPLLDVGLEYLQLGQPTETLSGGECQRLKLAGHLASSRKPRCLFLLDEPTVGLHPADVLRLLDSLNHLLDTGHSVVVIENNLEVIKRADHIIGLGPGSGSQGGKVVAAGSPEEVAKVKDSITGNWINN